MCIENSRCLHQNTKLELITCKEYQETNLGIPTKIYKFYKHSKINIERQNILSKNLKC